MSVCIPIVRVTPAKTSFVVNYWDDRQKTSGISTTLSLEDIIAIDPEYYSIPRLSASCKPVIYKMLKHKSIKVTCYEGELNVTSHRQFFTSNTEDPVILKGASIQRYYYTYKMSQGHIDHLNENHYLKQCGQSNKSHHHDKERIVMQGMTGANDKIRLVMTIVPKGIYLGHSCKYILLPPNIDIHFALGFYNSKLANWFFKCFSTNSNVNGYEIESIPFPAVYNNEQEQIANIVKNIISVKKLDCNADTSTMEYQIDKLIYEIFNLSKDDIAIVEGK